MKILLHFILKKEVSYSFSEMGKINGISLVPISPPQDVIAIVLSPVSLTINWAPPSIEDSHGYILGYHIQLQVPANDLYIMIMTADTMYTRTGTCTINFCHVYHCIQQ